jgi:hypothetical protein
MQTQIRKRQHNAVTSLGSSKTIQIQNARLEPEGVKKTTLKACRALGTKD